MLRIKSASLKTVLSFLTKVLILAQRPKQLDDPHVNAHDLTQGLHEKIDKCHCTEK